MKKMIVYMIFGIAFLVCITITVQSYQVFLLSGDIIFDSDGATDAAPVTDWCGKIYDAGLGHVWRMGTKMYSFDARIYFWNGTAKQIDTTIRNNGSMSSFIVIEDNASLIFGNEAADNVTEDGCNLVYDGSGFLVDMIQNNHNVSFYGCHLDANTKCNIRNMADDDNCTIKNCLIEEGQIRELGNFTIYNSVFDDSYFNGITFADSDNVISFNNPVRAVYTSGERALVLKNSKIYSSNYDFESWDLSATSKFVNVVCAYNVRLTSVSSGCSFNRNITFDVMVQDNLSNPIDNVHVVVTNNTGVVVCDMYTDASGSIPYCEIIVAYWDKVGTPAVPVWCTPFNISFSCTGYQNFTRHGANLTNKTDWTITLLPVPTINITENFVNCTGTYEYVWNPLLYNFTQWLNITGNTTSISLYENIYNISGTHEYFLNGTGYEVFANYTGNNSILILENLINCIGTNTSWWNGTGWTVWNNYTNFGPFIFNNPNPINGQEDIPVGAFTFVLDINHTLGSTFNYSWYGSEGTYNIASGNTNGTKFMMFDHALTCGHTYTISVNATDDISYLNQTYAFSTVACSCPLSALNLTVHNPNPANGTNIYNLINRNATAINVSIDVLYNFTNPINITFWSNSSGEWAIFGYQQITSNGTIYVLNENFTNYSTVYYWNVSYEVNHTEYDNQTFSFTMEEETVMYSAITGAGISCGFLGGMLILLKRRRKKHVE